MTEKIAKQTKIKPYHLDNLFWQPGWKKTENSVFRESIKKILGTDDWIIDGDYQELYDELKISGFRDVTIVYLNTNRWRALNRVLRRTIYRIWTKEKICNDNQESVYNLFLKESIILYAWKSYKKSKHRCEQLIATYECVYVVSKKKQVKDFLGKVPLLMRELPIKNMEGRYEINSESDN